LILLIKILLCTKFPQTKFINCKCFDMRFGEGQRNASLNLTSPPPARLCGICKRQVALHVPSYVKAMPVPTARLCCICNRAKRGTALSPMLRLVRFLVSEVTLCTTRFTETLFKDHRGTSLTSNRTTLGPYSRPMPLAPMVVPGGLAFSYG